VTSCTGSSGTWTVGTTVNDGVTGVSLASCYIANIAGGNTTVTFNFNAAASTYNSFVVEYYGVTHDTMVTGPVDQMSQNNNVGSTATNGNTCGTLANTINGDMIVSTIIDSSTAMPPAASMFTAGTGFTVRYSDDTVAVIVSIAEEDRVQVMAGSITPTWTASLANRTACLSISLIHQ
jgi:hypothetical protein